MKLTAKGRYAVTAMLDLAVHEDKGPISLADISERQGYFTVLSRTVVREIMTSKPRSECTRGPGGVPFEPFSG